MGWVSRRGCGFILVWLHPLLLHLSDRTSLVLFGTYVHIWGPRNKFLKMAIASLGPLTSPILEYVNQDSVTELLMPASNLKEYSPESIQFDACAGDFSTLSFLAPFSPPSPSSLEY